jgi:hypothetical protein
VFVKALLTQPDLVHDSITKRQLRQRTPRLIRKDARTP